ncbi:MAG: hypothetical protein V2I43_18155 [Parvularcula sp.]|jgi:hypothetical protein|nr:hypothetical protein [Parvularcula sp.]
MNDLPRLYTLREAAVLLASDAITARSLRTEYEAGRLRGIRIAGKLFVTRDALVEMMEANEQCQDRQSPPGSSFTGPTPASARNGKRRSEPTNTTLSGGKGMQSESVQRALLAGKKLKPRKHYTTSSQNVPEKDQLPANVSRLK